MTLKDVLQSINIESKKLRRNLLLHYQNNKSSRFFIIIGACFVVLSAFLLNYIMETELYWLITFLSGLVTMIILITGYSLMHKSLRGEWL